MSNRSCLKFRLLTTTLIGFALAGCGSLNSLSFKGLASSYREVLEAYSIENILINVVRASERLPLSFLEVPTVIGTGLASSQAGVGSTVISSNTGSASGFLSAAAGSSFTPSVSLAVNTGFNFTQTSLDNSSFMQAFLTDITPAMVATLANDDIGPLSLLLSLVVESIELQGENGQKLKWINNPLSVNYKDFQLALNRLIDAGITITSTIQTQPLSAPMTMDSVNSHLDALVRAYALPGVALLPAKGSDKKITFQLTRLIPEVQMCLSRTPAKLRAEGRIDTATLFEELKLSAHAFCKTDGQALLTGQDSFLRSSHDSKPTSALRIKLRSTRNVFEYVGQLVELQNGPEKKIIKIKNSDMFKQDQKYLSDPDDDTYSFPLIIVEKNGVDRDPLARVAYRNNSYSIPTTRDHASRQTLSILSQLLTLNKVPGSIPASPAVLIR